MKELKVRGRAIRSDENGLICLTDIWDAAGFSVNQKPADWRNLPTTVRLLDALANRIAGLSGNKTKPAIKSMYYSKVGRGGGTFAHAVLACAYAGYLSPKLEVEVREVWLRYRSGDPTLADEVLERASPEANLWVATRAEARAIRNGYTDTLRDHDVYGRGYMDCTDEAYLKLFGGRAKQLRSQRGLPQGSNLRDAMDIVELSAIKLTEALATQRITVEDSRGNLQCKEATGRTAANVKYAIDLEMKDRQKRLGR
ncbi:KilA-N domain-containing protein [Bradyrhizobium sp. UFLA03-84]|uniref:KilA-N domain-containing protein n=1 Tax=Bradyrhizobium sp. UFLA03-84 TaxID=418599 RepID=UPI0013042621|nr:KilA-N domain-containing protein [Bradyrhizobium sp. UFLA03-84]